MGETLIMTDHATDLRKFLESMAKTSAEIFTESGELSPRAILVGPAPDGPEDALALVLMPLGHLDKNDWRAGIQAAIEKTSATMLVFASEVWIIDTKTSRKTEAELRELLGRGGSLSSQPESKEALSFVAEDRHGNNFIAHQLITRDEAGKPALGPLMPIEALGRAEGRFVSFMPPPLGRAQ
jgi:hypothetical protein